MKSVNTSPSRNRTLLVCPKPGILPGSRKRRAFSSNGPNAPTLHCDGVPFSGQDPLVLSINSDHSICSTPVRHQDVEANLSTPDNCIIGGNTYFSPTMNEMSIFQHLSLRSPCRIAQSPGSSFSVYPKSGKSTCCTTVATGHSFDSEDTTHRTARNLNSSVTPSRSNSRSNTNMRKTIPLTVLSGQTTTSFLSPHTMDSTGSASRRQKFFPSTHPKNEMSPMQSTPGIERNVAAVAVTEEKRTPNRKHFFKSSDTAFVMGSKPQFSPRYLDSDHHEILHSSKYSSPPIRFLSLDKSNDEEDKGDNWNANCNNHKRENKSSWSLLRPLSPHCNDALYDMLKSNDVNTEGSLSDSDEEDGAFFLEDPCFLPRITPQANDSLQGQGPDRPPYCEEGSLKIKRKKTQDEHFNPRPVDDSCFDHASLNKKEKESCFSSTTSLFGMNIIHEDATSECPLNISLVPRTRNSSFTDHFPHDLSSSFSRSSSHNSFSSIGLSIEEHSERNDVKLSGRDMVTPPVTISNISSTPPPLKKMHLYTK